MQICTAQHLISHLSVKVPSVGSPGGPGLMSRRALDRNMREEGEVTRAKETVKEKGEGGQNTHPDMFGHKEGAQLFKACWTDRRCQHKYNTIEVCWR